MTSHCLNYYVKTTPKKSSKGALSSKTKQNLKPSQDPTDHQQTWTFGGRVLEVKRFYCLRTCNNFF